MRATTENLLRYYLQQFGSAGKALEIGGHSLEKSAASIFKEAGFEYFDLNLQGSDAPKTIAGDITGQTGIEDGSFDFVFSSDVFEHLTTPWTAAKEIARVLKPGGVAMTVTLWAWRNHPCPIDYWRFSPECLEFLFSDLRCVEKGYDLSQRRMDQAGFWDTGMDSVPIDELGGWREHWAVYFVGTKKGAEATIPRTPFRATDDPLAPFLRMSTQGSVTRGAMPLQGAVRPRYCPQCAANLEVGRCEHCSATLMLGARYCAQCGASARPTKPRPARD